MIMKKSISNIHYAFKILFKSDPFFVSWKMLVAIYEGALSTIGLMMLRRIINDVGDQSNFISSVWKLLIYCLFILICQSTIYFVDIKRNPIFTHKVKKHITTQMFEKATQVDFECYEDPNYYNKYCITMSNSYGKCCAILDTIVALIKAVTTFVASGILSLIIDPWVILFAFLPFATLLLRKKKIAINYKANQKISNINRQKGYVMRVFYQDVYAKEMRTTHIHRPLLDRFLSASQEIKRVYRNDGIKVALIWIIETFLNKTFSEYAVLIYASWKTLVQKTMQYGDCLVLVSVTQSVYFATNSILECITGFQEHSLYITDLREFLDYKPKIKQDPGAPFAVPGDICLNNVSFRYLGSDQNVLDHVNMTIKKGERVALVGANGAGKSTLIKLLLRLYDPTEGGITLAGSEYQELNLRSLRECYSVVLQDYKHFSISVKENIILGDKIDEPELHIALEKSGLQKRIEIMANGDDSMLDKELDEAGEVLSGGEQQKLAIARVYYKNSDIVILDEPASALDPIAEHDLYEKMMSLPKEKTVIFVSHRLSSTVNADKIIYLEKGKVIECGTHKELMALNGMYAQMFQIQAQNYMED